MKLAVIANRVCRMGGMERASAEVFSRIAPDIDTTIIATECEIASSRLTWLPVHAMKRPARTGRKAIGSPAWRQMATRVRR